MLSWKGLTRIIKSNFWLHAGPLKILTLRLGALCKCTMNSGTGAVHTVPHWGRCPGQPVLCPLPSGAAPVPNPQLPLP